MDKLGKKVLSQTGDTNKESTGFKSRRMIKTNSGVIKTVEEMKDEYYVTKRFNVELLIENQELGRLNNQLNSENLKSVQEVGKLAKQITDLKSKLEKAAENEVNKEKTEKLTQNYEQLMAQKKKLLEDSKGLTEFMLTNFKKVLEELKDCRDELDFIKRELSIEFQLIRRQVMKELVPKIRVANDNLNMVCADNDKLENLNSEIALKVKMISENNKHNENGARHRTSQLCNEIFAIQDAHFNPDSDDENSGGFLDSIRSPANDNSQAESDTNYNKMMYSEVFDNKSGMKFSSRLINTGETNKLSIQPANENKNMSQSQNNNSKCSNSSVQKYQINYDNSYMGHSSSGDSESEEFNTGVDVLLKEYMTDKIAKKDSKLQEGTKPPYNTEQPKEIKMEEYILGPKPVPSRQSKTTIPSGQISQERSRNNSKLQFDPNSNELNVVKNSVPNESMSANQTWENNEVNKIQNGEEDRESGFEDIVERFIKVVCVKNSELQILVCKLYNKMFTDSKNLFFGTNEEMLKSLKESQNFKNQMIECLSENDKKDIAEAALEVYKLKKKDEPSGTLNVTVTAYESNKKISRADDTKEGLSRKLELIKSENKFLVKELENKNKLSKSVEGELEKLREERNELQRKNEGLNEDISVLQQRFDILERDGDNQTDVESVYYDDQAPLDIMSGRLSNNMLIIQETNEEYDEIDSMISGQDLQDMAQNMILKKIDPKYEMKMDNGSVDNESHYSFFKDMNKSEIDETEADFDTKGFHSLPEIVPKKIRRRATTHGRRSLKMDTLQTPIEGFLMLPKKKKKRKTLGNMGINLLRKRLEKSESYNVKNDNLINLDFEKMSNSLHKTLDNKTSKSQDNQKIEFSRMISEPISKSVANNYQDELYSDRESHIVRSSLDSEVRNFP